MPSLPPPIQAYVDARNNRDVDAMAATFAPHATVRDEGRTHREHEAIRAWLTDITARYGVTLQPRAVEEQGSEVVVTSLVSGTFPGSPVTLRHRYTLAEDGIATVAVT